MDATEALYYCETVDGYEKLDMALSSAAEMLTDKGINVTDLELRMLVEAAVGEFNDAFNKTNRYTYNDEPESVGMTD